jgi:prevent-host-death family protein
MSKRVSATDAKNNFGGLLDDVAVLGRVEIVKHGRVVAIVLSPHVLSSAQSAGAIAAQDSLWGARHMIPPERARAARIVSLPDEFDES